MLKNSMKTFSVKRIAIAIVILLVSLSMIPWIISNYSLSSGTDDKWITVGNKSAPANVILGEYNAFIQQNYQYVSQNPYALFQYLNNLISQHVMVLLFANEAEKLHLQIDDNLLLKVVAEIPAFQKPDGTFDREKFKTRITSIFGSEKIFLDNIKNNLLKEQLVNSIGGNIHLPYYVGYIELLALAQVRNIEYVDINPLVNGVIPTPTLADLTKIREDNKKTFSIDENRDGEYLYVRVAPLLKNIQVTPAEINSYYNAHTANYMQSEQRNLLEINFTNQSEASEAFKKIANMKLADINKAYKVITLQNVETISLPEQLAKSVFASPVNVWHEPVSTDLGWHIFMVNNITPQAPKALALVQPEIKSEILAEKKKKAIDEVKVQLVQLAKSEKFNAIATKFKGSFYAFKGVSEKNISTNQDIIPNEDIFHNILSTKANSMSEVLETESGDLFMVKITSVNPARIKEVAEIKSPLVDLWNKSQKAQQVEEKAAEIMVKLSSMPIHALGIPVLNAKISRSAKQSPFGRGSLENLLVSSLNKPMEGKLSNGHTFVSITTSIVNSKELYKNQAEIKNQKVINLSDYVTQQYVQSFFERYATKLQSEYKVHINEKAIMEKLAPNP